MSGLSNTIAAGLALCLTVVAGGAPNDWAEGTAERADGATRDYYNRAARLEWKNRLGDWADARNVAQGPAPYATAEVADDNRSRFIEWDVTALVRQWLDRTHPNQGLTLRGVKGRGTFRFRSREWSDASRRPQLVIRTGRVSTGLAPQADTYLEPSTYRSMGHTDSLKLDERSPVLLRFDLGKLPKGARPERATLRLFTHAQYGNARMTVGVFRCAQGHGDGNPRPALGLAAKYPGDAKIESDADVVFAADFEDGRWAERWSHARGSIETVASDAARKFEPLAGKALRGKLVKGVNHAMSVTYNFRPKTGSEPNEVYFRYYLRLGDDWNQTIQGGKMPGFGGTYGRAGWGGRRSNGTNGWSARGAFYPSIREGNPLAGTHPIGTYCYHADQPGTYGDSWVWSRGYRGFLRKNRWYCVEQYVKLNTPGRKDGVLRAWVDGRVALEKTDIRFRHTPRLKIEQIWFNVYHGGKKPSPHDQHLFIDNVVIARKYVGPIGRRGPGGGMPEALLPAASLVGCAMAATTGGAQPFQGRWVHAGPRSAVVYWRMGDPTREATSHVEYGPSARYGSRTRATTEPRWAHLHRLTALEPSTTYHCRLVMARAGRRIVSDDFTFTTPGAAGWTAVPGRLPGPPYVLGRPGKYLLTRDVVADGTAIVVEAADVVLELDGHTVTFGAKSARQAAGIQIRGEGRVRVLNGVMVQGGASGDYSAAVESRWLAHPREIAGMTITVSRPNGYPVKLFGRSGGSRVHHNVLVSRVAEIESRHYPGNDLLRVDLGKDPGGRPCEVHDNILTGGCHRGIAVRGASSGSKVFLNDIRHHAMYVNGYAISLGAPGIEARGNRITSTGRGMHLTGPGPIVHGNYLDIKGHATLDDMPAKSRPFKRRMVELHGIKLEGRRVTGAKVYGNTVRIRQRLPEGDVQYVPATPLNVACYDPAAINEIYGNRIVALTHYRKARFGGYGDSGRWASALHFVSMTKGVAPAGKYSAYIHDNEFVTNHLYVSADRPVTQTVRVEKNTFVLAGDPPAVAADSRFRRLGELEKAIRTGNTFRSARDAR